MEQGIVKLYRALINLMSDLIDDGHWWRATALGRKYYIVCTHLAAAPLFLKPRIKGSTRSVPFNFKPMFVMIDQPTARESLQPFLAAASFRSSAAPRVAHHHYNKT